MPDERIAKFPLAVRHDSKLLLYQRGTIRHDSFRNLPNYIAPGTLMVFNNTRVIQARLHFRKETGARFAGGSLEPHEPIYIVLTFHKTQRSCWL